MSPEHAKFKIRLKNAKEVTAIEMAYDLEELFLGTWSLCEIVCVSLRGDVSQMGEDALRKLEGHEKGVSCLKYFEPKSVLISGGFDCHVVVWNMKRRAQIIRFRAHEHYLCSIQIESTGEFFYTVSKDNSIKEWNAKTGRQSERFGPYFSNTCDFSFTLTPCEKFLAACNFKENFKVDMFNILSKKLFCDFDDVRKLRQAPPEPRAAK